MSKPEEKKPEEKAPKVDPEHAELGAATLPLKPVERTAGHPDAPK